MNYLQARTTIYINVWQGIFTHGWKSRGDGHVKVQYPPLAYLHNEKTRYYTYVFEMNFIKMNRMWISMMKTPASMLLGTSVASI